MVTPRGGYFHPSSLRFAATVQKEKCYVFKSTYHASLARVYQTDGFITQKEQSHYFSYPKHHLDNRTISWDSR